MGTLRITNDLVHTMKKHDTNYTNVRRHFFFAMSLLFMFRPVGIIDIIQLTDNTKTKSA